MAKSVVVYGFTIKPPDETVQAMLELFQLKHVVFDVQKGSKLSTGEHLALCYGCQRRNNLQRVSFKRIQSTKLNYFSATNGKNRR